MRNVASVSSDESSFLILCSREWSPTQFVLQCDQWFHDGLIFFFRMSIIPSPCSFFFSVHLEWSFDLSADKKRNAICIFANLCSTLFSLLFKFSSAWFYFLSKCKKKRGQKLTGKNVNVNIQIFRDVIRIFYVNLFNLIAGGGVNTSS